MSGLSKESRDLLLAAGEPPPLGDERRRRMKQDLLLASGVAVAGAVGASTSASAAAAGAGAASASGGVGLFAKIAIAVGLIGGTSATVVYVTRTPDVAVSAPPPAIAETPAPVIAPEPVVEPVQAIEPAHDLIAVPEPTNPPPRPSKRSVIPAPPTQATQPSPEPPPPAVASPEQERPRLLAAELELIRTARSALAAGNAESVLATVRLHANRHPAGFLAEEREALWIEALCALGRTTEAKDRAQKFTSAYAASAQLPRIRRSCAH